MGGVFSGEYVHVWNLILIHVEIEKVTKYLHGIFSATLFILTLALLP